MYALLPGAAPGVRARVLLDARPLRYTCGCTRLFQKPQGEAAGSCGRPV